MLKTISFLLEIIFLQEFAAVNVLADEVNNGTITELKHLQENVNALNETTKILSDQLEKWNNLFLSLLEPRMVSVATSLANIDSNINSLQERAHVWDTFQLHVTAWNDQLATLNRKADIISKGQEKILDLESKINTIANIDYKISEAYKKIDNIEETVSNLKESVHSQNIHKDHNTLFNEFATRGILSTVKTIEKKLDRILLSQQNSFVQQRGVEKPKLTIKCNTPPYVEELLNDISSKVDVIFDRINAKEENQSDFDPEDYLDDGSGVAAPEPRNCSERQIKHTEAHLHKEIQGSIEQILSQTIKIGNISQLISNKQETSLQMMEHIFKKCTNVDLANELNQIIKYHVASQTRYFELLLSRITSTKSEQDRDLEDFVIREPNKQGCENLYNNHKSGVYIFGKNSIFNRKQRNYNKRYCLVRTGELWTVVQARGTYPSQNFNLSWFDYKNGFGHLDKDFWFGNDFLSKLSNENNVLLRIELEDFTGRRVWAEYNKFVVLPEQNKYQIIIGGYRGNASDSFSSHNGSFFSTFDQKNDQAPDCCPCAISYGGGWWFNSCFESNLNGFYYNPGEDNGHYGGLIWETWLGNRSLKKTLMMVKISPKIPHSTLFAVRPYFEDP